MAYERAKSGSRNKCLPKNLNPFPTGLSVSHTPMSAKTLGLPDVTGKGLFKDLKMKPSTIKEIINYILKTNRTEPPEDESYHIVTDSDLLWITLVLLSECDGKNV